jgi:hypothetical protein
VLLHESGFARSQICACRIAAVYESRIALQSAAPSGDTKTQTKNPSTAAITAKDNLAHLRSVINKRCRSERHDARCFYLEIRAPAVPALLPGPA